MILLFSDRFLAVAAVAAMKMHEYTLQQQAVSIRSLLFGITTNRPTTYYKSITYTMGQSNPKYR